MELCKNVSEPDGYRIMRNLKKRNSVKMGSIKNSGKGTWTDRNPGVLSNRRSPVAGTEKRVERPQKHRDGRKNNPKRWDRKKRVSVLYQQPKGRCGIVQPGSKGTLECGKYALAFRRDI